MRPAKPRSDKRAISRLHGRSRNLERRSPGPWKYVGDATFCDFINGANMAPTADVPDPTPLRLRLTLGAGLEIQGDVTGVVSGDIVCTFPAGYRPDHDVPVDGHDDAGNYVACRLYANGNFVYGVT